jgi:hypothetical protein
MASHDVQITTVITTVCQNEILDVDSVLQISVYLLEVQYSRYSTFFNFLHMNDLNDLLYF